MIRRSNGSILLEMLLQLGRHGPVEIVGDVDHCEQVLLKPALFEGPLIRNQLCFRPGNDDLLAGGGTVHQLGKVRLRVVQVDSIGHCCASGASQELTSLTNRVTRSQSRLQCWRVAARCVFREPDILLRTSMAGPMIERG
jgi:hypothetical protein